MVDTSAQTSAVRRTRLYRRGVLEREDFPVGEISGLVGHPDVVVWLDLLRPTEAELVKVGDELGLHELAVEDAVQRRQRPKVDHYADHCFVNLYAVRLDDAAEQLTAIEVAAFVTPQALVTIRMDPDFDMADVVTRWDQGGGPTGAGVGYLLHGLLDHVVDGHFAAVESLDEAIEGLEDELFDEAARQGDVQRRSFRLRKNLVLLRRVVLPMREVVNGLMRRDANIVTEPLFPYYQDVYDHVLRATEWTESLRDLVTTVLETNLTISGNRLNVITKKVTSWAAIIAVPTAITGFYGQNLPYPGFARYSGFVTSSLLIVVISALLYVTFRRKNWL